MAREISNHDDVIDSRDVIERIAELQALADDGAIDTSFAAYGEMVVLDALASTGEANLADWPHGETLIRDSYFVEYAQELAEDIGALPSDAGWPAYCIDWERAARDLRMDYTSIEFDGVTYWARS